MVVMKLKESNRLLGIDLNRFLHKSRISGLKLGASRIWVKDGFMVAVGVRVDDWGPIILAQIYDPLNIKVRKDRVLLGGRSNLACRLSQSVRFHLCGCRYGRMFVGRSTLLSVRRA